MSISFNLDKLPKGLGMFILPACGVSGILHCRCVSKAWKKWVEDSLTKIWNRLEKDHSSLSERMAKILAENIFTKYRELAFCLHDGERYPIVTELRWSVLGGEHAVESLQKIWKNVLYDQVTNDIFLKSDELKDFISSNAEPKKIIDFIKKNKTVLNKYIKNLDINSLQLKEFPLLLSRVFVDLKTLNLWNNDLSSISRLPPRLEELHLGNNLLTQAPKEDLPKTLKILDLSDNAGPITLDVSDFKELKEYHL